MDLNHAIQAHSEWKTKFRAAISKHEQMDVATLSHDTCSLGKWLQEEGKQKYSLLNAYKNCVEKHTAFHKEVVKIAQAINSKKYAEAEAMMESNTSYTNISNALGAAIIALKKEASL